MRGSSDRAGLGEGQWHPRLGTSISSATGSIIATGLALGFAVDDLVDLYRALGEKVFEKGLLRFGLLGAKFPKEPLRDALDTQFGDATLGGDELRTGLMVMTKRLDTGSPWLFHNNPRRKFFDGEDGSYPNPICCCET